MRHLVEGLRDQGLLGDWHIPAKSSLFRARQRLGPEPLRVLFATTAKPMGTEATPGCFWRGLRLLAVDGTCWDVADSPANEAAFGRPGNSRGHDKSCFPQMRMAYLIEVGPHLVLDAELAGCRTGEVTLVSRLPRSCVAGQLVLADRRFWACRCGGPSPPAAPICCGGCPPTGSCPWSGCCWTDPGFRVSTPPATAPTPIRSQCGWWPASCTAPARRPRTTGW
ncbi:transposase domain-containing protein [Streptomyces sp. NPDC003710]